MKYTRRHTLSPLTSPTKSNPSPPSNRAPAGLTWVLVVLPLLGAGGCGHGGTTDIATLAAGSDRALWEAGDKALQKKQYLTAREYLTRLIENFPGSSHQPLARLARADSYFQEGGDANQILAAADYREFSSVYPSHARADYAQFQVGECYFKQRLRPDRDQTNTEKALDEFQRFLTLFPGSSLADQARERVKRCRSSLARAEYQVGFFYQRTRQSYRAAILRYEGILRDYPDFDATDETLLRLAECLVRVGRGPEALPPLARLLSEFPKSPFRSSAEQLERQARTIAAQPVPTPAVPPGATVPPPQPLPSPAGPTP